MVNLSSFNGNNVLVGTKDLFGSLGLNLITPSDSPLPIEGVLPDAPNSVKTLFDKIRETYFVGTIDDQTLHGKDEALSLEEEVANITEHYKGMMVFAVDITDGETINRGEIASLNRALNRASKAAPVALIVRYGEYLSFSICERTAYKQSGHTGEKPGKVSLLRDINLANPNRGHIDILKDMNAKGISTFDNLYEKWLKVFDNDILTDRFYVELQNWYFWAVKTVSFPNDINDMTDGQKYNPETVIRLITRLVFVWFLKQKGLVPGEIFEKNKLQNILKDFDPLSEASSQYYRAILQNLFFATLNKKIGDREFAFDEGWTKNRSTNDVRNLYRFEKDFVWWDKNNPTESRSAVEEQVLKLFSHVPYMNNSLFECLDKKELKGKTYYWDGFSRSKKYQANVPNKLFFVDEECIDLTDSYLDLSEKQKESELKKYRKVHVHGLINILERYHFTIEENTPLDVDVALDPELLGKAFEQLLAAYNPETKKTVRKSTGSYYTPRPIVQYMVDESIVAYLNRTVPSVPEETVRLMLGYGQDLDINLTDEQRQSLVEAVFNCRILDPACGSGAFPMGILQQLSHLLSSIDTNNKYWEDLVMARAMEDIKKAAHLDEEDEAATKADIKEVFDMSISYPDYARKLYLIENCIYGVDIQSIAVQISRLRFFISLLCEQKPTENAEDNFGVRPLPNLEMKFVTANTLVKPNNAEEAHLLFEDKKIKKLIDELQQVRHNMFIATSAKNKKRYFELDIQLREKIAQLSADNFTDELQKKIDERELLLKEAESKLEFAKENLQDNIILIEEKDIFGEVTSIRKESSRERKLFELSSHVNTIKNEIKRLKDSAVSGRNSILALARQLTDWNPYDQNVSSPFFDPDWMFGVKDGFDIVIGNPPYVRRTHIPDKDKILYEVQFKSAYQQYDLYLLFIEQGISFLKDKGFLCYINPIKFLISDYGLKNREILLNDVSIKFIVDVSQIDVFDASTYPCILGISNELGNNTRLYFENFTSIHNTIPANKFEKYRDIETLKKDKRLRIILNNNEHHNILVQKIEQNSIPSEKLYKNQRGIANSKVDFTSSSNVGIKSTNVSAFCIQGDLANISIAQERVAEFKPEMVIIPRTVKTIRAAIKPKDLIVLDRIYYLTPIKGNAFENQYIVGLLNSKLISFWFEYYFSAEKVQGGYFDIKGPQINQIPIAPASPGQRTLISNLVIELIRDNQNEDFLNKLDFLVYQLYGLNYDEVLIIDSEPPFTREEYEKALNNKLE